MGNHSYLTHFKRDVKRSGGGSDSHVCITRPVSGYNLSLLFSAPQLLPCNGCKSTIFFRERVWVVKDFKYLYLIRPELMTLKQLLPPYSILFFLQFLIQSYWPSMPPLGGLNFQSAIHFGSIYLTNRINDTHTCVFIQHLRQQTHFRRKKKIQIVLCNLYHNCICLALMNEMACNDLVVWKRY